MKKIFSLLLVGGIILAIPLFSYAHEVPTSGAVLIGEGTSNVELPATNRFTRFMQMLKTSLSGNKIQQEAATASARALTPTTPKTSATASAVSATPDEFHSINHALLLNGLTYKSNSIFSTEQLKTTSRDQIYALLTKRKAILLSMIKNNPSAIGAYALPLFTKTLLPDGTQGLYEKPTALSGSLLVFHEDDFSHRSETTFRYQLAVGSKLLQFYPTRPVTAVPGTRITVNGFILDDNIVGEVDPQSALQSYQERNASMQALRTDSGDRKVLALMVKFTDSPEDPFTAAAASSLIFNGQFQKFYTEQSYQKVHFAGEVRGWYTINRPTNACDNPTIGWDGDLDSIIAANGIDLSQYSQLVIITNCAGGYTKGYAYIGPSSLYINGQTQNISVAWVSASGPLFLSNSIWSQASAPSFAWSNLDSMLSHEVGHGFGLWHSNGYDCGAKTSTTISFGLDPTCSHVEYGNSFDVMGDDRAFGLHFNAFYKELAGWFDATNSITATTSGTYTINKYENGTGNKMLKIQMNGSTLTPYYVEYRTGFGFDAHMTTSDLSSNKSGLLVTRAYSDAEPPYYQSRIFDIRPTASAWNDDVKAASLNGTKVFTDARTGISIGPITAKTASAITFSVGLSPVACVRNAPLFRFPETYGLTIGPGSQFVLYPTLYNDDYKGCAPSNMNITMTLPAGLTASPLVKTMTGIAAETAQTFEMPTITASSSITPGTYNITLKGKNIPGNKTKTITVPITVTN